MAGSMSSSCLVRAGLQLAKPVKGEVFALRSPVLSFPGNTVKSCECSSFKDKSFFYRSLLTVFFKINPADIMINSTLW